MKFPEYRWVDFANGDVSRRNHVTDIAEAVKVRGSAANSYITVYRFPDSYLEHCQSTGSVKGYAGHAYADYLPIDIDREGDLDGALKATICVAVVLHEMFDIDPSKLRYFFSGAKGYHLLIPVALMGEIEPSPLLPLAFRTMALGIADMASVEIDGKIYDINRLFRLADTQHGTSRLWKIELTWAELSTGSPDDHRELARRPRLLKWEPHDLEPSDALVEYAAKHFTEAEDAATRRPSSRLGATSEDGTASKLAAALSPAYYQGQRHELVLAFAGYAAKRSLPRETAIGVIHQLGGGDDELEDRIRAVEDTYDRVREGVQVRGYTDLAQMMAEVDLLNVKDILGDRRNGHGSNGAAPPPEQPRPARQPRVSMEHVYDPDRAGRAYLSYARQLVDRRVQIGIPSLDRLMRGLMPGTVTTLVAKSRVGKSIIAQNIRRNIAHSVSTCCTVFFSLEMPIQLVWERDAQFALELPGHEVERRMREAPENVAHRMIAHVSRSIPRSYTVTAAGLTLDDMLEYCDMIEQHAQLPIAAVLIDYLSLIRGPGKDAYNTTSGIARNLKPFAKDLDAPVVVLCQVRRRGPDGEKVDGSTAPTLEDPRDSGAIEEGSDSVIGAWRPKLEKIGEDDRIAFRLLKNRMGVAGPGHDVVCEINWRRLAVRELQPDELPSMEIG